jgi:signal transduction histidine kinase
LREALAEIIGDSELELAYPLEGSERLVDSEGRVVELSAAKQQTNLVGDGGRCVAVLAHQAGLLDDEQLAREVTEVARLALENERLQAEVRARLVELKRSRARIVEAGDEERRRLERDLHDGAQQRLAGLALSLRLLRTRMDGADAATVARIESAEADVKAAIEQLRELAHGLFPAVLVDGGLAAALVSLAEDAHVPIRLENVARDRVPPGVEAAAYAVVAQTVSAAAGGLVVRADRSSTTLVLDVEAHEVGAIFDGTELEDRVGAADGRLTIDRRNGTVTIHAEFPCAS